METYKSKRIRRVEDIIFKPSLIPTLLAIVSLVLTLYFYVRELKSNQKEIVDSVFIGLLILICLYYIYEYLKEKFNKQEKIENDLKDVYGEIHEKINQIKKDIQVYKEVHEMKTRISILEQKKRKGQIDPRVLIILVIIIIIIIYLLRRN